MKCTILFGSPRPQGNTAWLTDIFCEELKKLGVEICCIPLYSRDIRPCLGCMTCQDRLNELGCVHRDDFESVFNNMVDSDLILFATPIYAWYCTAPMKALLDRAIYAGNKNYGHQRGPAMLAGKNAAALVTCGYPEEKGADVWEAGLKRVCRHSKMNYLGMLCCRDLGSKVPFANDEKERRARAFARSLYNSLILEDV